MHIGRWVTGSHATTRVCKMVEVLDQKELENTNRLTGMHFSKFEPWMSCTDELDFFVKNQSIINGPIVTDRASLLHIANTLQKAQAPLGRIGMLETDAFYIDQKPSETFTNQVHQGLKLAFSALPHLKTRWDKLIDAVIPVSYIKAEPTLLGRGLSNHRYRKAIFIQLPKQSIRQELQIALNLVHELGHQTLITYQNADLIISSNREYEVYSIIRNTKRPIIRSFHAFFVTGSMLEFLIAAQKLQLSDQLSIQIREETAKLKSLLLSGSMELRKAPVTYTPLASEIIDELESLALISEVI